jgi:hypothetical protein
MLGNIPAFDTNFRRGFRAATFGPKSFRRSGEFYQEHAGIIESNRVPTLDFLTGQPTHRRVAHIHAREDAPVVPGSGCRISD